MMSIMTNLQNLKRQIMISMKLNIPLAMNSSQKKKRKNWI